MKIMPLSRTTKLRRHCQLPTNYQCKTSSKTKMKTSTKIYHHHHDHYHHHHC